MIGKPATSPDTLWVVRPLSEASILNPRLDWVPARRTRVSTNTRILNIYTFMLQNPSFLRLLFVDSSVVENETQPCTYRVLVIGERAVFGESAHRACNLICLVAVGSPIVTCVSCLEQAQSAASKPPMYNSCVCSCQHMKICHNWRSMSSAAVMICPKSASR